MRPIVAPNAPNRVVMSARLAEKTPMLNLTADTLEGRYVRLEPVTVDHRDELKGAIDCDPDSWEIMSVNGCGEGFEDFWGALQGETQRGERIGYAIRRLSDGKVVGTSSYLNIRRLHGGLEIGSTFLNPDARSGPVNPESKRLMLSHAFDKAGAIRVELVTDVRNARSQAAIEKLGASKEGVLRNHKITWTGHVRDTAVFSITDYDWPAIRERLEFRLAETFV
ncbi:acetyltransferase, ribosomal protein N-acetylase [Caulobacter vibrioides OR37]|jgi:RimJ/RimL family protein N-acetyltransferase|uniref:Acetyltransferase, ribosomal protein N-acetylase n=2 Tax=Caulobacteraceae TaxID=76892 RepID=R0CWQ1_CAUVI|nr:acetyltransferase, ribosomal protein N-acetylase [Caulobacter vibrioides OR37]